jgi:Pro-kumamolisin, activation domain
MMNEFSDKAPLPGSERAPLDRPPIGDVPGNESIDVMVALRPDIDGEALDRVMKFLEDHGLTVESVYGRTKTLHVRGPAAAMQDAFSVKLARYFGESGDQFRARSGAVYVPDDVASDVTAVLGLDDRNTARPWHAFAPRAGGRTPLTPLQVAKAGGTSATRSSRPGSRQTARRGGPGTGRGPSWHRRRRSTTGTGSRRETCSARRSGASAPATR